MTNEPTDTTPTEPEYEPDEGGHLSIDETYGHLVNAIHDDIRKAGIECIDFGDRNNAWQDLEDGMHSSRTITGWLNALSLLSEREAANQVRWELTANCEHTQFAVQLADEIHDTTVEIQKLTQHLWDLKSHYMAILVGRKSLGVNYTSEEGEWVPVEAVNQLIDNSATRKFNLERLKQNETITRRKPVAVVEYLQGTHETIEELMTNTARPA